MLFQRHPARPGLSRSMQPVFSPPWAGAALGLASERPALQVYAGGQGHGARLTQRGGRFGEWAAPVKAKLGLFSSLSELGEFS